MRLNKNHFNKLKLKYIRMKNYHNRGLLGRTIRECIKQNICTKVK